MRTMSSRRFNQDTSGAKLAAASGPVVITDRGQPSYVLVTYETYHRLVSQQPGIIELLAEPDTGDIDFESPAVRDVVAPASFD
jgi:hypothetical protein